MGLDELERLRKIKPYEAKPRTIQSLLLVARRDLVAAERNLPQDLDWSFNMSYNAALQAARALMLSQGYRPRGADQHRTVVRFVKSILGEDYARESALFDQMRRKRNRLIYETVGLVSRQEAEQALEFAKSVVDEVSRLITGQLPMKL
jgi:uncharacterized protein (UPF0332 family)